VREPRRQAASQALATNLVGAGAMGGAFWGMLFGCSGTLAEVVMEPLCALSPAAVGRADQGAT